MCFDRLKQVAASQVSAFKVFGEKDNRLISCFVPSNKPGLFYPPNEKVQIDEAGNFFFAFADMGSALKAIVFRRRSWNLVTGKLVVLPVTLSGEIFNARYTFPSNDIQCLDPVYPAFCSTEIEVHDTVETRVAFAREVVRHDLKLRSVLFDKNVAQAYQLVLPELCPA